MGKKAAKLIEKNVISSIFTYHITYLSFGCFHLTKFSQNGCCSLFAFFALGRVSGPHDTVLHELPLHLMHCTTLCSFHPIMGTLPPPLPPDFNLVSFCDAPGF